jgi:Sap, sulfolipid-1-addressing protein
VGQAISEVLTLAVGVAISPVPIIAVILMLFSGRARLNGPLFLLGWAAGLAIAGGVVYALADAGDAGTDSGSSDTVSWLKMLLGVLLLFLAGRDWRQRPAPGGEPEMPKWMAGVDALSPAAAVGLGFLLSAVNPKNLALTIGAAAGLAQLGVSTVDAVVALIVYVVIASLTIAGPVVYYLTGGAKAETHLDELKEWLTFHNAAVMAVLLLVFGVVLIAQSLATLSA